MNRTITHANWVEPGHRNSRSPRKDDAEWKKHKRLLIRLYKEYPLVDVMTYMEAKHGFFATYVLDQMTPTS